MLKLLYTALKVLLALVLLAALGVGLYFLVEYRHWPWWAGVAIFFGLLAVIMGLLFLKRWLFRRRERRFVQRIVEQDETLRPKLPVGERQQIKDLRGRWLAAVNILKQSHLKKYGDPLYVQPWFLVLGQPGSGKTAAIRAAGLPSPLTEVSPTDEGPTRNAEWWFFDQSVVLDTPGRYVVQAEDNLDIEEWRHYLQFLTRHRRRESISGLVAVVSANLFTTSPADEAASEEARHLRRRIDEVMRVLGTRFPVWVLVTKVDSLIGLSAFADLLPIEVLGQAMGLSNQSLSHEPANFVAETINVVTERLKDLRLALLDRATAPEPGLLLFPGELAQIQPGLTAFVETLFTENPYQETPLLRGIYFSSARQAGPVRSEILAASAAFRDHAPTQPTADRGVFLTDFWSRILPADRGLITPIREYISWRKMTRGLGITAWLALFLFALGALSVSYIKNRAAIEGFTVDISRPPALTENLERDLLIMDRFRSELREMEDDNSGWWVPRLGLTQSQDIEDRLKVHYCAMFRLGFLNRLDLSLARQIDTFTSRTPGEVIGAYVEHLVTRLNLLQARLGGASSSSIAKMPGPSTTAVSLTDQKMLAEIAASFAPQYLSYLQWNANRGELNQEMIHLQAHLQRIAQIRTTNMRWLVQWADIQTDLKPVTLDEFWGQGRLDRAESVYVRAAFTVKGRARIEDLFKRYGQALGDRHGLAPTSKEFDQWYWREYIRAWEEFGHYFDVGYITVGGEDDRRTLAENMADAKNPYYQLLDRMAEELESVFEKPGTPVWVNTLIGFQRVKKQAAQQELLKTADFLTKTAEKGEQALKQTLSVTDPKAMTRLEYVAKAAEQLKAYEKALTEIIPVTTSREMAFKMATKFYPSPGDKEEVKSPFQDAHTALTRLKGVTRPEARPDNLFWRLLYGPLRFLLAYMAHDAACELQLMWEGNVLGAVQDLPAEKLRPALFDNERGLIWKFLNGPAGPFVGRSSQGYYARSCLDQEFPIQKSFLSFLEQGAASTQFMVPEYTVNIKTRPLSVNRGALLEPFGVTLVLDCAPGPFQLENFNYPANLDFKWTPDKCGAVSLKIMFSDFTLTKRYEGPNGFPDFLDDFAAGTRTFHPDDFPDNAQNLANVGVTEIRVGYLIDGSEPVRKLLKKQPAMVPLTITECYGNIHGKQEAVGPPPIEEPPTPTVSTGSGPKAPAVSTGGSPATK